MRQTFAYKDIKFSSVINSLFSFGGTVNKIEVFTTYVRPRLAYDSYCIVQWVNIKS